MYRLKVVFFFERVFYRVGDDVLVVVVICLLAYFVVIVVDLLGL